MLTYLACPFGITIMSHLCVGNRCVSQREGLQRKAHSKGGTTAARTCSEKPDAAPVFFWGRRHALIQHIQKMSSKVNIDY